MKMALSYWISIFSGLSFCYPLGGCTREALYIVLGASHCDWHLLLWVTLPSL